MVKTITKVMAGLGIVAGIGVSALPLTSYAADVVMSVTIAQEDTTATCDTGSITNDGTPDDCTGGGNNAKGYTATITDKSGSGFDLVLASANDPGGTVDGTTVFGIKTITAFDAALGANEYGILINANTDGITTGAYGGAFGGSLVDTDSAVDTDGTNLTNAPIRATIGTITSSAPGEFNVGVALTEQHDNTLAPGTYTNAIAINFTPIP